MAFNKAVFLDRDGTLNPDPGYISTPEDFCLFPGVPEALARLKVAGFLLVLITNQSGIARKIISPPKLCQIHDKLQKQLLEFNAGLDRIYACPHHPDFGNKRRCGCRKPAPGLALKAISELGIDPARSFLIGDKESDVNMAKAAGITPILLRTTNHPPIQGVHDAAHLPEAVELILNKIKCTP